MPRLSKGDIAKIADAVVSRLQSTQPAIADSDDDLVETVRANMRQGRGTIIPGLTAMPTNRIELPESEQPPLREEAQQDEFEPPQDIDIEGDGLV